MAIELSYINTKHPDFTEANILHRTLMGDNPETVASDVKRISVRDGRQAPPPIPVSSHHDQPAASNMSNQMMQVSGLNSHPYSSVA